MKTVKGKSIALRAKYNYNYNYNYNYYPFKLFRWRRFWLFPFPRRILHNQRGLIMPAKHHRFDGIFDWKGRFMGNRPSIKIALTAIWRRNSWIAERRKSKIRQTYYSVDVIYFLRSIYICLVYMNNKTIIEIGFRMWRICRSWRMLSTSAFSLGVLDLHHSSHPTQSHSIIANYNYITVTMKAVECSRNIGSSWRNIWCLQLWWIYFFMETAVFVDACGLIYNYNDINI